MMTKGLEALEKLGNIYNCKESVYWSIIETELKAYQEWEKFNNTHYLVALARMSNKSNYIEEFMLLQEVLKIIKEKRVDVNDLLNFVNRKSYNEYVTACDDNKKRVLTKQEYGLLKEILE